MSGVEYLEHLHAVHQVPWPQLVQMLLDPEENRWTLAMRYGLRPIHVATARRLCMEIEAHPRPAVAVFLQSKIHFEQIAA